LTEKIGEWDLYAKSRAGFRQTRRVPVAGQGTVLPFRGSRETVSPCGALGPTRRVTRLILSFLRDFFFLWEEFLRENHRGGFLGIEGAGLDPPERWRKFSGHFQLWSSTSDIFHISGSEVLIPFRDVRRGYIGKDLSCAWPKKSFPFSRLARREAPSIDPAVRIQLSHQ